jgi:acyl-CoA synthetase (NDP forming)
VILCVNLIWRQGEALADALIAARAATERLLAVSWIAGPTGPVQRTARGGVPVFGDPLRCVRAVAARLHWDRVRRATLDSKPPAIPRRSDHRALPQSYAAQQALLERHGVELAPGTLVGGYDQARRAAHQLGYPIAAKLIAPSLPHKSDAGGVVLGIADDAALARAVDRLLAIPCADREGLLIQKMIDRADAVELFVGLTQDRVFGPIALFGLGGVFVEIVRDVVMRPAPFDPDTAAAMIRGARFFPMLHGARGRKACDLDALAQLLAGVSVLAAEPPWLATLDLNPVLASPRGAIAVDFKLELADA